MRREKSLENGVTMSRVNLMIEEAVVLLNGKIVKTALVADSDEGWVEIPDISAMAPLNLQTSSEVGDNSLEVQEELKRKRLHGKVEIKLVGVTKR